MLNQNHEKVVGFTAQLALLGYFSSFHMVMARFDLLIIAYFFLVRSTRPTRRYHSNDQL